MNKLILLIVFYTSFVLTSCGGSATIVGSSSSSSSFSSAQSSEQSEIVSKGMISGLNGIVMEGVHYDLKGAIIEVDGNSLDASWLKVGQIARINATYDGDKKATYATKIFTESQLIGDISKIDIENRSIVVLGQTVILSGDTFLDKFSSLESLNIGDVVTVNGYLKNKKLMATRVETRIGVVNIVRQVSGEISNLDTSKNTFSIGETTVNFENSTYVSSISTNLKNGMVVNAKGVLIGNSFVVSGDIGLSPLDIVYSKDVQKIDKFIVGGIAENASEDGFEVNGLKISLANSTFISGGDDFDIDNERVVVEGYKNVSGSILANSIYIIGSNTFDHESLISSIDFANKTIELDGKIYRTNQYTSYRDSSNLHIRSFDINDLSTGNLINVRGYYVKNKLNGGEDFIVTRLERKTPKSNQQNIPKIVVSGTNNSANRSSIEVAGYHFRIIDSTDIPQYSTNENYFLTDSIGRDVVVEATYHMNEYIARKVYLK